MHYQEMTERIVYHSCDFSRVITNTIFHNQQQTEPGHRADGCDSETCLPRFLTATWRTFGGHPNFKRQELSSVQLLHGKIVAEHCGKLIDKLRGVPLHCW